MKQIYPSTITGKSFAPGGSVLDHAFGKGDLGSLAVLPLAHLCLVVAANLGRGVPEYPLNSVNGTCYFLASGACINVGDSDDLLQGVADVVIQLRNGSEPTLRCLASVPKAIREVKHQQPRR